MKPNLSKAAALLLAILLLAALPVACGKGKTDAAEPEPTPHPAVGTYTGVWSKFVGDDDSAKNTSEPFSMDLNADGTGVFHRDGNDFRLTWTLDGETITLAEKFLGIQNDYTGTLVNGRLDLFTGGEPSDPLTYEYVLEKQN